MAKANKEKWDRSGFNELLNEEKLKQAECKKHFQYKPNKDSRPKDNQGNPFAENLSKQHLYQQIPSVNKQIAFEQIEESTFRFNNQFNKPYRNYQNGFRPRKKNDNQTENSLERKLPEKQQETVQAQTVKVEINENQQKFQGNPYFKRNNFNNGKRGNFNNNQSNLLITLRFRREKTIFQQK
jgi:hypothetical protein